MRRTPASGAKTASLAYDPLGRLWQVSGGAAGTTRFLYDGDKLLEEYDGGGTRLRAYGHGPGLDEPLVWYELTGGPERRFLHANHQGSIIAAADESGNALAINAYDAWGIPNANNLGRFAYTGQTWLGCSHDCARTGSHGRSRRAISRRPGHQRQCGYRTSRNRNRHGDLPSGKDPSSRRRPGDRRGSHAHRREGEFDSTPVRKTAPARERQPKRSEEIGPFLMA